ncbi:MAG: hypothetical protein GY788_15770 [bacterium]|nr:hypothetical protein [bacterium]
MAGFCRAGYGETAFSCPKGDIEIDQAASTRSGGLAGGAVPGCDGGGVRWDFDWVLRLVVAFWPPAVSVLIERVPRM